MPKFAEEVSLHDVIALRKTPAALVCLIENEEFLIPDSQISDDSEVWKAGDKGTLIISQFIAEKKGLHE